MQEGVNPRATNLSEVAATSPAPGTNPGSEKSNKSPHDNDLPLSEATAPPPISQDPTQRHLWDPSGYPLPEEAEKTPSGPIAPTEEKPPSARLSKTATHLFSVSYLIFFAIFGTLARIGLQTLTVYPGAPIITGVLWPNVGGSLLMGFFLEDRNIFREEWGHSCTQDEDRDEHEKAKNHKSVKKTIPLYIGLTTGFCGCFTSFSTFIRDVFFALSNDLPDPSGPTVHRNGGYSFMGLVAVILVTVSLSLSSLVFGAHLALALHKYTPTIPFRLTRRFLDPFFTVLGLGCWLGAVFMAIWPPDRFGANETWRGDAIFAIVFAPLGCLLRFYLSLYLNTRIPSFPLGTFTANMFGTAILGMCYDLQHVSWIGGTSVVSCQVLQGVMDGFCGSTTTISTWVAELNGLGKRRFAYIYGIFSVGIALALLVVIMGSFRWTIGFGGTACSS